MVTTAKSIQPEMLPHTERSTYFHALRVHLQVVQWRLLNLECLDPMNWGWKITMGTMTPIKDPGSWTCDFITIYTMQL